MDKLFSNPFKRKEREAERLRAEAAARERSRPPGPPPGRQGTIPRRQLQPAECLAAVQSLLEQIRLMNPHDIHAFPLLNQSQRLVQELRDAVNVHVRPAERNAWQFQIQDLQDEVQMQTTRLLSSVPARAPVARSARQAAPAVPGTQHVQALAAAFSGQVSTSNRASPPSAPAQPTPQLPTSSRVQPQAAHQQPMPSGHAARQSALFGHQRPLSTSSRQGSSAPGSSPGVVSRAGMQSPSQQQQQPGPAAGSPADANDLFSGLSVVEQSSTPHNSAPSQSGALTGSTGAARAGSLTADLWSCTPTSPTASAFARPANQSALSRQSGAPSSLAPALSNSSTAATEAASFAAAAMSATAHRRGSSWSTDALSAISTVGSGAPDSPSTTSGTERLDSSGKRVIKKKTRGLKVGHGTLEDPDAPSTAASLGSFTDAAACQATFSRSPSSLASTSAHAWAAQSGSLLSQAQQQRSQHLQQHPQPQQQVLQQRASADKPSGVAAAAARRLNLPSTAGSHGRAKSPPLVPLGRVSEPANAGSHRVGAVQRAEISTFATTLELAANGAVPWILRGDVQDPDLHSSRITSSMSTAVAGPGSAISPGRQRNASSSRTASSSSSSHGRLEIPQPAMQQQQQGAPPLQVTAVRPPAGMRDTPVDRYVTYVSGLSGTLDACHQAAAAAANDVVQQLSAAAAALQQQMDAAMAALAARRTDLATCAEATATLERQQQLAVDQDDYDTAASLDERLQQVAAQAKALQEAERRLQKAAEQLGIRQQDLLSQQAQVWEEAARYLRRIHDGHVAAVSAASQQQQAELSSLEQQQAQVQAALAEAAAALDVRRAELAAARQGVEGRSLAASLPAQTERDRLVRQQAELQAEVHRLQELLNQRTAQLQDTMSQLALAERQVAAATASLAPELAAVADGETQLQTQEAALRQQTQVLDQLRSQAEQRRAASEQQRQMAGAQANALLAAAQEMLTAAEETRRRAAALTTSPQADLLQPESAVQGHGSGGGAGSSGAPVNSQTLTSEEAAATTELEALNRTVNELTAEVQKLEERSALLQSQAMQLQAQTLQAAQLVPQLEAGKKAAAARKDFKEAAKLSAEHKQAQQQAERLSQEAAVAQQAAQQGKQQAAAKSEELRKAQSRLPGLKRDVARARHRALNHTIEQTQLRMNVAAAQEQYDEAQQLQARLNSAVAETAGLEEAWGFSREGEEALQAQQRHPVFVAAGEAQQTQGSEAAAVSQVNSGATSSHSSSLGGATVLVHASIDGRDSSEVAEATSSTPSAAADAQSMSGPTPLQVEASSQANAASPGAAIAAGPSVSGGAAAEPTAIASHWHENDMFEALTVHEPHKQASDEEGQLPTRAAAEQLLQEAEQTAPQTPQ